MRGSFHRLNGGSDSGRSAGSDNYCAYVMLLEYASDESGVYSKVVDAGIVDPQAYWVTRKRQVITISPESREVVAASGQQLETLIATWKRIWKLTASGDLARAFSTDGEMDSGT